MKATEQLKKDHEAVIDMLHIMESVSHRLSSGSEVPSSDMEAMVDFLRTFVDKYHHGKEEDILFPKLVEIGIPNEGGPVGVMLAEHIQGRNYIRGFADGIELYKMQDHGGRQMIVDSINGYVNLLENHIHKENNILFLMADMHLEMADQDELSAKFEDLREKVIGGGKNQSYQQLLELFKKQYC